MILFVPELIPAFYFRSYPEHFKRAGIIKDKLELFRDLLQYRNSTLLEWIMILILVEVLTLVVDKVIHCGQSQIMISFGCIASIHIPYTAVALGDSIVFA